MANNLGVTIGSDATIKTTDNAGVHTPHKNIEVAGVTPAMGSGVRGSTVIRVTQATDDFDLGSGTGGSKTQRVIIDTAQLAALATSQQAFSAGAQGVYIPSDHPSIVTSLDTAKIGNGTAGPALTPKFAKIAVSSSGNNAIVAAVTSKKIRVLQWRIRANGAVNTKWQSDGGGTPVDLTGLDYMTAAGDGAWAAFSPVGHFESESGKSLDLNLSGAVAVGGSLVYVEV